MTKILGISAFYHDSAATVVIDGKIIAETTDQVWLTSDVAVDGILSVLEQDV